MALPKSALSISMWYTLISRFWWNIKKFKMVPRTVYILYKLWTLVEKNIYLIKPNVSWAWCQCCEMSTCHLWPLFLRASRVPREPGVSRWKVPTEKSRWRMNIEHTEPEKESNWRETFQNSCWYFWFHCQTLRKTIGLLMYKVHFWCTSPWKIGLSLQQQTDSLEHIPHWQQTWASISCMYTLIESSAHCPSYLLAHHFTTLALHVRCKFGKVPKIASPKWWWKMVIYRGTIRKPSPNHSTNRHKVSSAFPTLLGWSSPNHHIIIILYILCMIHCFPHPVDHQKKAWIGGIEMHTVDDVDGRL